MSDQKPLTDTQRMWNLVRQQRMELFNADLITQDEYAALAVDHPAVARLESYDELRAVHAETREQLKEARKIIEVYFSPWGAAKAALWEELSNDGRFDAETGMNLIRKVIGIPPADAASQPSSPEAKS